MIVVTRNSLHQYWIVLHILIPGIMFFSEYLYPGNIKNYHNPEERLMDIFFSYATTLIFIYFVTKSLREYYISQKQEAEQSETKLRALFQSSSSALILIGMEEEIIYFNLTAAVFIRQTYQKDLQVGQSILSFISSSYRDRFYESYHQASVGVSVSEEIAITYPGNGMIWWQISHDPVRNIEGKIIGVAFNSLNITERKKQEESILLQNQSLTRIAYIQSHELRSPVTAIQGIMNLIKEDNYNPDKGYLLMMEQAVEELDKKIQQIVSYTEIRSNEL